MNYDLATFVNTVFEDYKINYDVFIKSESVLIYGAGEAGKRMYSFLQSFDKKIFFIDDIKQGTLYDMKIYNDLETLPFKPEVVIIATANEQFIYKKIEALKSIYKLNNIFFSIGMSWRYSDNDIATPPCDWKKVLHYFEDNDYKRYMQNYNVIDNISNPKYLFSANMLFDYDWQTIENEYSMYNATNRFMFLENIAIVDFSSELFLQKISFLENTDVEYFDIANGIVPINGDTVIDCGANSSIDVGEQTTTFAKLVGDSGKVYAFEPTEHLFNGLQEDVKMYKNINIYKKALGNYIGEISFCVEGSGSSRISNTGQIKVPLDTIDNFVKSNQIQRVDFIKMDIEGAEMMALSGAIDTIRTHKPKLAISLYHKSLDFIEITSFIKALVPEYKLFLKNSSFLPWVDTDLLAICK